jgi:hypothetical protein
MFAPLRGRRPKRKARPDKICMTPGCTAKVACWQWLCNACFHELPYLRKKEICDARAARDNRVFSLSREAGAWLAARREERASK